MRRYCRNSINSGANNKEMGDQSANKRKIKYKNGWRPNLVSFFAKTNREEEERRREEEEGGGAKKGKELCMELYGTCMEL